jgi:hypothetical protein
MPPTFVTVSTHSDILDAEMTRALLSSAGIESYIQAPFANALYPGVLGEVRLQVKEEDLDRARDVLGAPFQAG